MNSRDDDVQAKVRHDLFFTDASNFGNYLPIGDIQSSALKPVWRAFQSNIESVRVMSLLPQVVARESIDHLLPLAQAVFNVLGKPVMDDTDIEPNRAAISEEYGRIVRRFFDGKWRMRETLGHDLVMHNKRSLVNFELTRPGFFKVLEAQVILVWVAYETLTTDLCVAAVNAWPKSLYNLGRKTVRLRQLIDGDWNGRLGELLRTRVRFDNFQETKRVYKRLFADAKISTAIDSQAVTTASIVRNLLIHNCGIVTATFAKRAKSEPWQSMPTGDQLALDGKNVSALVEGVIECANELIRAVDDWLHALITTKSQPPDQ